MTNAGRTSWHGFATEIVMQYSKLVQEKDLPALKARIEYITAII